MKIIQPTLLLDKQKCLNNIDRLCQIAQKNKVTLRPHFKTHQSLEVGRWFRDFNIDKITASSFRMAEYFAADGWQDITVAFPVNILEIDRINDLAKKVTLNLLVESEETIDFLETHLEAPVFAYVKMDLGSRRSGLAPDNFELMDYLIEKIESSSKISLKGFLGHSGHSYKARSKEVLVSVQAEYEEIMKVLKSRYSSRFPDLLYSIGDTPTCSLAEKFENINEMRPGNFVFYDVTQCLIGSCNYEDVAVAMACPVVAKHATRNEIIVYGGGVHFSKDRAKRPNTEEDFFGWVVDRNESKWELPNFNNYLKGISQEHGIIKADKDLFEKTKVGDVLTILPIHSCMTADLMRGYVTLDGQKISARDF